MPERPIECSHCQKPADITYKQIAQGTTACTQMCHECPILQKKLYGMPDASEGTALPGEVPSLCCAICMTTLESLQTGGALGCSHCYVVFEKPLLEKFLDHTDQFAENPFPLAHRGKTPQTSLPLSLPSQLETLSEALHAAVQKEQYEQAAWLRDQIKELKAKTREKQQST